MPYLDRYFDLANIANPGENAKESGQEMPTSAIDANAIGAIDAIDAIGSIVAIDAIAAML